MSSKKKTRRESGIWREFKKNKGAIAGLILLSIVLLIAIFADFIVDYETQVIAMDPINRLQPSCGLFFLTVHGRAEPLYNEKRNPSNDLNRRKGQKR